MFEEVGEEGEWPLSCRHGCHQLEHGWFQRFLMDTLKPTGFQARGRKTNVILKKKIQTVEDSAQRSLELIGNIIES